MYTLNKSKKAVSVIIGYVLLITFAVVLGVIVYTWMKTYVPQEDVNCPDEISLFIDSYNYDLSANILTLNIKNNGKFSVGGYFIYATNNSNQQLATIDLSKMNNNNNSILDPLGIIFGGMGFENKNSLAPNSKETDIYNLTSVGRIYLIEIVPIRWQTQNREMTLVSCKDAEIKEQITPGGPCIPESSGQTCTGYECGTKINNCGSGVDCGNCAGTDVCNSNNLCVPPSQCTDTCSSLGYQCGTHTICGVSTNCPTCPGGQSCNANGICITVCTDTCLSLGYQCGTHTICGVSTNCPTCPGGQSCNNTGQCVSTCNGVWNPPESVVCDGGALCFANCTCQGNYVPDGNGGCGIPQSVQSCPNYCAFLGYNGVPQGSCRSSSGNCGSSGGVYQIGGDVWCTGGSNADACCCYP